MRLSTTILSTALLCAAALAQDPVYRGVTQLPAQVTTDNEARVCTPKQNLPALAIAGAVHTGQLVHTLWLGPDAVGAATLFYRRSIDGGASFEPAQALWTVQAGEVIDTDFRMACHGHEVWVALTSERMSDGSIDITGDDHLWLLASDRQGIAGTWSTLHVSNGQELGLSTTDEPADVNAPELAAVSGSVHISWEYTYDVAAGIAAASGLQGMFYQRVDFVAPGTLGMALTEEVRIETSPSGAVDVDGTNITAVDDVVIACWLDNRIAGINDNNWNDTFIRVSTDRGLTWGPEQNMTSFPAPLTFAGQRESKVLIWGSAPNYFVGVFHEDSRNGDDDIFMELSGSTGAAGSWTPTVMVSMSPVGADSDGMTIAVSENGTIYVVYEDDRVTPGDNASNLAFVVVDRNGGADFLSGSQVETQISTGDASSPPTLDCYENYAAIAFVDNIPGNDPSAVSYSYDNGATWHYEWLVDQPIIDADQETIVAVTTRGDVVCEWMDDRNGGNAFNNLFVGGLRTASIRFDAGTPAYVLRGIGNPGDANGMFFSLTPPAPGALQLIPADGWQSNFSVDFLTFSLLSIPFVYGTTDANREAIFPGLPNAATLIGLPVYVSAYAVDPNAVAITALTDTLMLNP
ncbi:MAG: exo-alpha-sialidase [Planctomycetes bacterium]|nr:exo-alpha-sialidase [Planctomycetota bacterium]